MATTSGMQNDTGYKSFTTSTAVAAYRAVELAADGTVTYPNANADRILGITQNAAASGAQVNVKLINAPGTFKVTCGAGVAAAAGGATLYCLGAAGAGKFDDADPGGGVITFIGLEAGSGDGAVIEAMPVHP